MSPDDTRELTALLAIRLAGSVDVDDLQASTRTQLLDGGHIRAVPGPAERAMQLCLTASGRMLGEVLLANDLDERGGRAAVTSAYETFLLHNASFLAICRDWQLRPGEQTPDSAEPALVANDHSDAVWDQRVLDRLAPCHEAVLLVVDRVSGVLPRFSAYRDRFENSLARVRSGDPQWFARPLIDSYHSVWFELHENLLATLGRDRHTESQDV